MHGHSDVSMDESAYHSGIRYWNTEAKLIFSLAAVIFVVVLDRAPISVFTFCYMGAVNIFVAGVSLRNYWKALSVPAVFILLGSVAIGINFSGEPQGICCFGIGAGYLYLSEAGLYDMFCVISKAFGAVSAMYVFTLSTPAGDFAEALRRFHLPPVFVELMHLVYRYIFILFSIYHRMKIAAESRLGFRDYKTSLGSFGKILGNLFLVSMKNANQYYDAMEARCYDGMGGIYAEKRKITVFQAAAMFCYTAGILAISVLARILS